MVFRMSVPFPYIKSCLVGFSELFRYEFIGFCNIKMT